jgi:hypothetical protein
VKSASFNNLNSFVKGWFIDESICQGVIDYFENNKQLHLQGTTTGGVDETVKKSTDLGMQVNDDLPIALKSYFDAQYEVLNEYKKLFPQLDKLIGRWTITEGANIQKYLPNEGYFAVHCENLTIASSSRMLVFSTFLNNVDDGGETEFPDEQLRVKAEAGLTIFFPPAWTHPHRGIVSPTQTKYIITGWYSFAY